MRDFYTNLTKGDADEEFGDVVLMFRVNRFKISIKEDLLSKLFSLCKKGVVYNRAKYIAKEDGTKVTLIIHSSLKI